MSLLGIIIILGVCKIILNILGRCSGLQYEDPNRHSHIRQSTGKERFFSWITAELNLITQELSGKTRP